MMEESISLKLARTFLGKEVTLEFDQPIGSRHPEHNFEYPINYGYVPRTKAPDDCELDAYLLNVHEPLKTYTGECIAIIHRRDDDDDKLVVVPPGTELTDDQIMQQVTFQEKWFDSVVVRG